MDFQVGDEVICLLNGNGTVVENSGSISNYPILVKFNNKKNNNRYTKNGKYYINDNYPCLFHEGTEINIKPAEPKRRYPWVNIYNNNGGKCDFGKHYNTKEKAIANKDIIGNWEYIDTIQLKPKRKTKNSRFWFTADEHYYHKNIIKYSNRPFNNVEEMNQTIIDNHNSVVSERDVTIHAGDFSFASYTKTKEIIAQLKGNHVFLKGDHDKWIGNKFYADIWKKTIDDIPVCVCHYAMKVWWLSHYNSWNLFGHSHGSLEGEGKQMDIGVDCNNYFPFSFDKLKQIMYYRDNNFNYIGERK